LGEKFKKGLAISKKGLRAQGGRGTQPGMMWYDVFIKRFDKKTGFF
jgi:hypothetical protein